MTFQFDAYVTAALFGKDGRALFALGDGTVRFESGEQIEAHDGAILCACLHPSGAGLLTGLAIGAFNGFMVAWLGINHLIVTLGVLYMTRGVIEVIMSGQGLGGFTSFPPGFRIRCSSASPPSTFARFLRPNAIVTASNRLSSNGRSRASPSIYGIG